uniref:Ig-like domain-containing protein n=1 Tax=Takifugu rubripes TaxID=31033 RepID=A0A674N9F2_TAKRU
MQPTAVYFLPLACFLSKVMRSKYHRPMFVSWARHVVEMETYFFPLPKTKMVFIEMSFTNGTVLIVNDHKGQNSLRVKQSKSVHPGGSVTLQCSLHSKKEKKRHTCPAEDNVSWIRLGSGESHPSIIYTPSHSSCEGEERSCFYTLSKMVNVSDKGTYYCAVDMCGQILFGGGTTQLPTDARVQFVVVIGILSVCCVLLLAALIICSKRRSIVFTELSFKINIYLIF